MFHLFHRRIPKRPKNLKVKATWWFIFRGRNGQTIVTSETYTRKQNAIGGMTSILATLGRLGSTARGFKAAQGYMDHSTGTSKPVYKRF